MPHNSYGLLKEICEKFHLECQIQMDISDADTHCGGNSNSSNAGGNANLSGRTGSRRRRRRNDSGGSSSSGGSTSANVNANTTATTATTTNTNTNTHTNMHLLTISFVDVVEVGKEATDKSSVSGVRSYSSLVGLGSQQAPSAARSSALQPHASVISTDEGRVGDAAHWSAHLPA